MASFRLSTIDSAIPEILGEKRGEKGREKTMKGEESPRSKKDFLVIFMTKRSSRNWGGEEKKRRGHWEGGRFWSFGEEEISHDPYFLNKEMR